MTKTSIPFTAKVDGRTVHYWPSNFFIEPDGTCVESEFQAAKHMMFGNPWTAKLVRQMPPGKAKRAGSRHELPLSRREQTSWERHKRDIMYELLWAKFTDHAELAELLLSTNDCMLVEENWWHDDEWGHCVCREHHWRIGKNLLGKMLMQIRHELGGPEPVEQVRWASYAS